MNRSPQCSQVFEPPHCVSRWCVRSCFLTENIASQSSQCRVRGRCLLATCASKLRRVNTLAQTYAGGDGRRAQRLWRQQQLTVRTYAQPSKPHTSHLIVWLGCSSVSRTGMPPCKRAKCRRQLTQLHLKSKSQILHLSLQSTSLVSMVGMGRSRYLVRRRSWLAWKRRSCASAL